MTAEVSPTVPATDAPPTSTTTSTTTIPAGTECAPADDFLVTPSGRRVLLRAEGVRPSSPLVLVLHGFTGTPTGIETVAEFTAIGNAGSLAVAYPEGTPTPTEGFGWASGASVFATVFVDDVAALLEMIDVIVDTGCVDPGRVVVAGESNGAGMALALACDPRSAGRIAGVVLVNAAIDEGVLAPCEDGAPVALPLSAVAGEIDATVPYEGGRGLIAQREWFAAASWLLAGCLTVSDPEQLDGWTTVASGGSCETCSVLYTVADGTHTWPGTSRGNGGLRPGTFDLNSRLLWIASAPPPLPCLPW
jgi:polyhydroxybutyrate depolymerase